MKIRSFQLIIFLIGLLYRLYSGGSAVELIKRLIINGGYGRGSYYVKMYLEFAILIPAFYYFVKKSNLLLAGGVILVIQEFVEILYCFFDIKQLWSWGCFRFLVLIPLGYFIAKTGVVMNAKTISLSVMSMLFILLSAYFDINLKPFCADIPQKIFHWPTYFYVAFLLLWLINFSYRKFCRYINFFSQMGRSSYEIFLFQMIVFYLADTFLSFRFIDKGNIISLMYSCVFIVASIAPVMVYKNSKKDCLKY